MKISRFRLPYLQLQIVPRDRREISHRWDCSSRWGKRRVRNSWNGKGKHWRHRHCTRNASHHHWRKLCTCSCIDCYSTPRDSIWRKNWPQWIEDCLGWYVAFSRLDHQRDWWHHRTRSSCGGQRSPSRDTASTKQASTWSQSWCTHQLTSSCTLKGAVRCHWNSRTMSSKNFWGTCFS